MVHKSGQIDKIHKRKYKRTRSTFDVFDPFVLSKRYLSFTKNSIILLAWFKNEGNPNNINITEFLNPVIWCVIFLIKVAHVWNKLHFQHRMTKTTLHGRLKMTIFSHTHLSHMFIGPASFPRDPLQNEWCAKLVQF